MVNLKNFGLIVIVNLLKPFMDFGNHLVKGMVLFWAGCSELQLCGACPRLFLHRLSISQLKMTPAVGNFSFPPLPLSRTG